MNWGGVSAFLAVGGYGGFVWGSYAVAAICIALEMALLVARHRKLRRQLRGGSGG
jgi:heme exporter protein D